MIFKTGKKHLGILYQWILKTVFLAIMTGFIIVGRAYCLFGETGNLPALLVAAFLLGNLFFFLSLLTANWNHFNNILLFFHNFRLLFPFLFKRINKVLLVILYIIIEELFWRGYLQVLFFNDILLVPLVTGLFMLAHFFKFKRESANFLSALEFYLYFLLLSYVFHVTQSIYTAVLIHLIRNIYAEYWEVLKSLNSKILSEEKWIRHVPDR